MDSTCKDAPFYSIPEIVDLTMSEDDIDPAAFSNKSLSSDEAEEKSDATDDAVSSPGCDSLAPSTAPPTSSIRKYENPKKRERCKTAVLGRRSNDFRAYFEKDGSPKDWKTEVRSFEFGKIDELTGTSIARFVENRERAGARLGDDEKKRYEMAMARVGEIFKRTIDRFFFIENALAKEAWSSLAEESIASKEPPPKRRKKTPSATAPDLLISESRAENESTSISFEPGVATDVWKAVVATGFERCDWSVDDACNLSLVCKSAVGSMSLLFWKRIYENSKGFVEAWEKKRLWSAEIGTKIATRFFVNVPGSDQIENKDWSRLRPRRDNKLKKSILWCPGCFEIRELSFRTEFQVAKVRQDSTLRCKKCLEDLRLIVNRRISRSVSTTAKVTKKTFADGSGPTVAPETEIMALDSGKNYARVGREWKRFYKVNLTPIHDVRPYVAYRSVSTGASTWESEWGLPTMRLHSGLVIVKNAFAKIDHLSRKWASRSGCKFAVDKLTIEISDYGGRDDEWDDEKESSYLKRRRRSLETADDIDFPPVWPPKLKYTRCKSNDTRTKWEFPPNVSYNDGFLILVEQGCHLYANGFEPTNIEPWRLLLSDYGSAMSLLK
jgi:hypothetical protein